MDKFVFLLELIGTVAFAASGSLTAMRRHMDLLGVIVLGVITSVGGGILRDVILGITPPLAFRDPTCTLVAVGVSLLLCIPWIRHSLMHNHRLFDVSLLLMDSVGLGVFTVMGIWNAMDFSPDRSTYLLVFVGLLTGVGGGVMRDVLAGNTPYILVKHVYACASLAGAVLCAVLWRLVPQYVACFRRISAGTCRAWRMKHSERLSGAADTPLRQFLSKKRGKNPGFPEKKD